MGLAGFTRARRDKKVSDDGRKTQEVNSQGFEIKEEPTQKKEVEPYTEKTVTELREQAKEKGITGYTRMKKEELIEALKG